MTGVLPTTFKKAYRRIRQLLSGDGIDSKARAIQAELIRTRTAATRRDSVIAVQCVEDPFYLGLFSILCQELGERYGTTGELVVTRSLINGVIGRGWMHRLAHSALVGTMISAQWVGAFRSAGERVAYRSLSFAHPLRGVGDWVRSRAIWRREQRNPDISKLSILDVPVGDLIIDSYLRFRPSPRFDVTDPFVAWLIWQAHRDIRSARAYFRGRKPKLYLTSYSTYVDHGVAVRVALQENIPVRSFGNFMQLGKELTLSDWFHTADSSAYRRVFERLDRQEERLAEAERQLAVRLSGGIDAATSYMKASAYGDTSEPIPEVRDSVVVFLHDFYDSPHGYDDLIFPDFWTWACFTIETLQNSGQKFFVKPHPNQIALSSEVIKELRAKYPAMSLLSANVSNAQLAAAGMICGVTMYGTVGHELAYFGVPTIACARHPHHAFDFCRTARSTAQLADYLRSARELPIPKDEMRRQALAFYYMHNLDGDPDSRTLKSQYIAFWKSCQDAEVAGSTAALRLRELRELPGFKVLVARLAGGLDQPDHAQQPLLESRRNFQAL